MIVRIAVRESHIEIGFPPTDPHVRITVPALTLRPGQSWGGHTYNSLRLLGNGKHDVIVQSEQQSVRAV
jgi:hypothetical protein